MGFAPRERCLDVLNHVEHAMVQLVRPVQALFFLSDKRGVKTPFAATRGPLIFVPVPVEGTFNHVLQTLPSATNMVKNVLIIILCFHVM
jgi:hypothetical protein